MRRKNYGVLLFLILISISLGYAFLQTDLSIIGTSKILATSWNVYFDNIRVSPGSVTLSSGDVAPVIDSTTLTDITYTVTLKEPGDFYEFLVDVKNTGTLDAMIDTISSKLNNVEITNLPAYMSYSVTYSDGVSIAQHHLLNHGDTETYKIRIGYRTDIDPDDLPDEVTTNVMNFGISYVQKNSSAITVPHPVIATVYTTGKNNSFNYNIKVGSPIPSELTQYSNAADAIAALSLYVTTYHILTEDVPFCLKHVTADDIVIENYLTLVVSNDMVNNNPGMTSGTYDLKGADAYSYAANKAVLQAAFGSSNCVENGNLCSNSSNCYYCENSSMGVVAYPDGDVGVLMNASFGCRIDILDGAECFVIGN